MQKRLVLLIVFVWISFIVFNRAHFVEGFKVAASTLQKSSPLHAKNVKEIYDDFVLSYVKEYQTLAEVKGKDTRAETLLKIMTDDINRMNREYPSVQESIQTFPYTQFPMISKEDLLVVKDFLVRTMGQVDSKKPLEPATNADLGIFTARLQALQTFLQTKFNLLPRETRDTFRTKFESLTKTMQDSLKYTNEYKKVIGSTNALKIPILKRMNYFYMILFSAGNFVWPSELAKKPTGPIQTDNLPIPKTGLNGLTAALQGKMTITSNGKAPICPSCPPPAKPCPVPPEGKKYSETVRDLLIENAMVKAYGGTYLYG